MDCSLPPCDATALYNALCNHCLVLDARVSPCFGIHCASPANEDEWDFPDDLDVCVLLRDDETTAETLTQVQRSVLSKWKRLEGKVKVLPPAELDVFRRRFPWVTSSATVAQPISWPSFIGPSVYLGSALHAELPDVLSAMGIKTIVNCMADVGGLPPADAARLGITLVKFNWIDHPSFSILPELPKALRAIESGRASGSVLIHCWRGASRSVAACAAWLLWSNPSYSTLSDALAVLRAARSAVALNAGFAKQLSTVWVPSVSKCGGPGVATIADVERDILPGAAASSSSGTPLPDLG